MNTYSKTAGNNRVLYKAGVITKLINSTIPASPRFYPIGSILIPGLDSSKVQVMIFSFFHDRRVPAQTTDYLAHPKGATAFVLYTGPLSTDNKNMNIDYELIGNTISFGLVNETGSSITPIDSPYNTCSISYFIFTF